MSIAPLDAQIMTLSQLQVGKEIAGTQNFNQHHQLYVQEAVKEKSQENETKVAESEKTKDKKIEENEGGGGMGVYYGMRKKKQNQQQEKEEMKRENNLSDKRLGNIIDIVR
ncbi:MAG TPA: hypothetical protein PLD27_04855 [bacterium]|nr:hypothetical protein [bacterium]HOL47968.1 hypothetical protein [bacterium]HPQ18044.1 hypothetical protein [bacterium]